MGVIVGDMDERTRRVRWLRLEMGFEWDYGMKLMVNAALERECGGNEAHPKYALTVDFIDAAPTFRAFQNVAQQYVHSARTKFWSSDPTRE